jgi:hypothetical protein
MPYIEIPEAFDSKKKLNTNSSEGGPNNNNYTDSSDSEGDTVVGNDELQYKKNNIGNLNVSEIDNTVIIFKQHLQK